MRQEGKSTCGNPLPPEGPRAGFRGSLGPPPSSSTPTSLKQLHPHQRPAVPASALSSILHPRTSGAKVNGGRGLQIRHEDTARGAAAIRPQPLHRRRGVHGLERNPTPPGQRQVPPVRHSGPALTAQGPLHECSFQSRPRSKHHTETANGLLRVRPGSSPAASTSLSPPSPAGHHGLSSMGLPPALTVHLHAPPGGAPPHPGAGGETTR